MTKSGFSRNIALGMFILAAALIHGAAHHPLSAAPDYLWPGAHDDPASTLADRIPPPRGFERVPVETGSFAEWLRYLPLRPPQTPVLLHDGRPRWSQDRHAAVVNIDTGKRNLQQCADAIMRLRAEYLLSIGKARQIAFNYTSGKRVSYRGGSKDRKAFSRYMTKIFAYAGTYSLEREMREVPISGLEIGNVFIKGGFPGHAVLVADMAQNRKTGERRFLLIQSFMPAQDMHVLKDVHSWGQSPWFQIPGANGSLVTPDWVFEAGSLRRFKD
jgi:hypothetical protein